MLPVLLLSQYPATHQDAYGPSPFVTNFFYPLQYLQKFSPSNKFRCATEVDSIDQTSPSSEIRKHATII
jgi:hypothetical protein